MINPLALSRVGPSYGGRMRAGRASRRFDSIAEPRWDQRHQDTAHFDNLLRRNESVKMYGRVHRARFQARKRDVRSALEQEAESALGLLFHRDGLGAWAPAAAPAGSQIISAAGTPSAISQGIAAPNATSAPLRAHQEFQPLLIPPRKPPASNSAAGSVTRDTSRVDIAT